MARRGRVGLPAGLTLAAACMLAVLPAPAARSAQRYSLRFDGSGSGLSDIVRIPVDDPGSLSAGPPADVGAADFTIEWWHRARPSENTAEEIVCGPGEDWTLGNVIVDRKRAGGGRSFGASIAGGVVVFGVRGPTGSARTICGSTDVADDRWHHVAVQLRPSDGAMSIYVDGRRDASGSGPAGDVSYPDDAIPTNGCGGSCSPEHYLALGSAKQSGVASFSGWLDEVRLSNAIRYTTTFTRPAGPFPYDASTVALYRFDEGSGSVIVDSADGYSPGERLADASGRPAYSAVSPFATGTTGRSPSPTGSNGPGSGASPGGRRGGGSGAASEAPSPGPGGASFDPVTGAPEPTDGARALAAPARPEERNPVVPPIAIALAGLGIAVALAARFLRGDRADRL